MSKQNKQKPQRSANFADRKSQEQKRINVLSEILHLKKPYEEADVPNEDRKGTKRYPCRWFANHTLELSFGFNQTASDSIQYPILFQLRSTKSLEDRKGVLGLYLKDKVQSDLLGKSVAAKNGKQKVGTARTEGYFDLQGFDIDWNQPDRWKTPVGDWYNSFCQKLESISFEDKVVGEFNEKQTNPAELENYFQRITTTSKTRSSRGKSGNMEHSNNGTNDSMTTEIKELLLFNHQVILTGAPGTGKTYLARQVAEAMVLEDIPEDAKNEDKEAAKKERIESVQFHPNYDYSDFVEGFKPKSTPNANGTIEFELKEGVFKCFARRALENFQKSQKSKEDIDKEQQVADLMSDFFSDAITKGKEFNTIRNNRFKISSFDDAIVWIEVPDNPIANALSLKIHVLLDMLPKSFKNVKEVSKFLKRPSSWWEDSYYFAMWKEMHELFAKIKTQASNNPETAPEGKKRFVFIIDEINRADLSRVFGELFSLLEEDYRYPKKQDGIMLPSGKEFHIPENLYIIGTMNDIDRSVESMDFALRRRFAWKEIKASDSKSIIDAKAKNEKFTKDDADNLKNAMDAVNKLIAPNEKSDDGTKDLQLGPEYQLGGAIFAKLEKYVGEESGKPKPADAKGYKQLWDNHIENILREYLRGRSNRDSLLDKLENTYYSALNNAKPSKELSEEELKKLPEGELREIATRKGITVSYFINPVTGKKDHNYKPPEMLIQEILKADKKSESSVPDNTTPAVALGIVPQVRGQDK